MANQEVGVGISAQPGPGQQPPKPQPIETPTAPSGLRVERAAASSRADQKQAKKAVKARQAKPQKQTLKEQGKALKKAMKKAKKSRERASVRSDKEMSRDEAVAYVESILKGLKKGTLHLREGKDDVVITPSDLLNVVMKAKARQKKESVAIRLSWRPRSHEK